MVDPKDVEIARLKAALADVIGAANRLLDEWEHRITEPTQDLARAVADNIQYTEEV